MAVSVEPKITSGKKLVVVLHGWGGTAKDMPSVIQAVEDELADRAKVVAPPMAFGLFGKPLLDTTREVLDQIDREWGTESYDSLVLVGYSLGALIVRKVYAAACGSHPLAPMEPELAAQEPRIWAERVERLVLLASIDRGWRLTHHVRFSFALVKPLVLALRALHRWRLLRIPAFECERGQPFVEDLRVQWARMLARHESEGKPGGAMAVQLVGTQDNFVGPLEAMDPLFVATKATRQGHGQSGSYVSLEVPRSSHETLIRMGASEGEAGEERRRRFRRALTGTREELHQFQTSLVEESQMLERDEEVTDVVFVIHGIRDIGYWTQHVAQRVKSLARREGRKVRFATETSTYGYFAMLPFVLSRTRRRKVEWLLDQHAENVVLYPNAVFHYIGHSNGTYLLARALESSRCRQFHHVVFAGSVVRNDYDWERRKADRQVQAVANYVATHDWVVAVFPWAIGGLQRAADFSRRLLGRSEKRDLGSAGDSGFTQGGKPVRQGNAEQTVQNIGPVPGAHSAALVEENWEAIARFIVHGGPAECGVATGRRKSLRLVGLRLFFLLLLVGVLAGLWRFSPWGVGPSLPVAPWVAGILYVAGLLGLYQVVTRV